MNTVIFESKNDVWSTPQHVFDALNEEFHFNLDPCANADNAKCEKYFTEEDDGLLQEWGGYNVFCNPPYSKIKLWMQKCYEESQKGATVVALVPSRTHTKWFHDWVYGKSELRFIKGRLRFSGSKTPAPFPSVIVIWRGEK